MLAFWNFLKGSLEMIASKIKAERHASELLSKYYLSDPARIDLRDILGSEGIYYKERESNYATGSLLRHKNHGQIIVNSKVKDNGQRRFIIAHELGHWLMHPNIPVFNCDHTKFKYWNKEVNLIEKEANWFASDFLMPKKTFIELCSNRTISYDLLMDLSSYFQSSITATAIRFAIHGNESIMVVYCSDGIGKWSYPSHDFAFSFFGKYPPIPESSLAFDVLKDFNTPDREDVTKTIDWFPNDRSVKEDSYIKELVIPMPKYKGCLLILWQHDLNFEDF